MPKSIDKNQSVDILHGSKKTIDTKNRSFPSIDCKLYFWSFKIEWEVFLNDLSSFLQYLSGKEHEANSDIAESVLEKIGSYLRLT